MGSNLDRPAVLTPEVQKAIVEALAEGNYLETACLAAGTTKETFNYWRRLYESGAAHAQKYTDFFTAVKKASATAERGALREVRTGAPGWQGNAWFLERRFPRRWTKKDQVTINATAVDVSKLSEDELATLARGKGKSRA